MPRPRHRPFGDPRVDHRNAKSREIARIACDHHEIVARCGGREQAVDSRKRAFGSGEQTQVAHNTTSRAGLRSRGNSSSSSPWSGDSRMKSTSDRALPVRRSKSSRESTTATGRPCRVISCGPWLAGCAFHQLRRSGLERVIQPKEVGRRSRRSNACQPSAPRYSPQRHRQPEGTMERFPPSMTGMPACCLVGSCLTPSKGR